MFQLESDLEVKDFDWVKARLDCCPEAAFDRLKMQIRQDVEHRHEKRSEYEKSFVGFSASADVMWITVTRAANRIGRSITFKRTKTGVQVIDERDTVVLEGTLIVDDEGECKLRVNGQELAFWQFRRRALEDLLFAF